jgi:hypothetical protein
VGVVIVAMAVIVVPVAIVVMIVVIVAFRVAVIAMIFVLSVVIAVIVADFIVILIAAEVPFPAYVAAPIGVFAASREWSAIAEVGIVFMVDVAVETNGAAKPGSCAKEDAACEPLRAIIAKGRALVWSVIEIAIGANRRDSDADCDLRGGVLRAYGETESSKNR